MELPPKQQHILSEWFETWGKYINFEESFKPEFLKYYKRGEIVLAHFGYNIGSELSGIHYAVVVENNNNKTNKTVTVVPLSSLEHGKSKDDLHRSEIYLGNILPQSNKESYAMPLQIRVISKMRIIKPKRSQDGVFKITKEQLNMIDNKLIELYTYQKKQQQE